MKMEELQSYMLSSKGRAFFRRTLLKHYVWFTHESSFNEIESIRGIGIKLGLPCLIPDEVKAAIPDVEGIVCLNPLSGQSASGSAKPPRFRLAVNKLEPKKPDGKTNFRLRKGWGYIICSPPDRLYCVLRQNTGLSFACRHSRKAWTISFNLASTLRYQRHGYFYLLNSEMSSQSNGRSIAPRYTNANGQTSSSVSNFAAPIITLTAAPKASAQNRKLTNVQRTNSLDFPRIADACSCRVLPLSAIVTSPSKAKVFDLLANCWWAL